MFGVIQRGRGACLAPKPASASDVQTSSGDRNLSGDEAIEPRVLRFVDHAHPAAAQLLDDAIVRDRLADQGIPARSRDIVAARGRQQALARRHRSPERTRNWSARSCAASSDRTSCSSGSSPPQARSQKRVALRRRTIQAPIAAAYRRVSSVRCPSAVRPASSRYNQALALFQSRITVTGDTLQDFGGLFDAQPAEEAHLHHLRFARVPCSRQRGQRVVEGHEVTRSDRRRRRRRHRARHAATSAPRLSVVAPRVLHEDTAHGLRRDGKEVGAILPLHARVVDQAQVRFVDEGRGLEAVPGALAPHVAAGEAVELGVHDGGQLGEGALVPFGPRAQQRTDVVRERVAHLHGPRPHRGGESIQVFAIPSVDSSPPASAPISVSARLTQGPAEGVTVYGEESGQSLGDERRHLHPRQLNLTSRARSSPMEPSALASSRSR